MKVHESVTVWVRIPVDRGIAETVRYLQTIPGVWTHASCQGTLDDENCAYHYRPQVMVTWENTDVLARLESEFDVEMLGPNLAYVHPRSVDNLEGELDGQNGEYPAGDGRLRGADCQPGKDGDA